VNKGKKKEKSEYPWQIPIADLFPASKLSEAKRRRQDAQFFYLFELGLRTAHYAIRCGSAN
jgi:hypothetical protein